MITESVSIVILAFISTWNIFALNFLKIAPPLIPSEIALPVSLDLQLKMEHVFPKNAI